MSNNILHILHQDLQMCYYSRQLYREQFAYQQELKIYNIKLLNLF
jgi:hypothetical protein